MFFVLFLTTTTKNAYRVFSSSVSSFLVLRAHLHIRIRTSRLVVSPLHRRCVGSAHTHTHTHIYNRYDDRFRISVARLFSSPSRNVVFSVQMCHALATASSVRMISGCPNCCCKRAATTARVRRDLPCHYYVNGLRYYYCTLYEAT